MQTLKLNSRVLSMAVASILAVGVGAFSVNSYAAPGTNTATLQVSADIQATCEVSTTAVAFSTYDPVGANKTTPLDNSGGKVTMTCTTGAIPKVALNLGLWAVTTQRNMKGGTGADLLAYNLYQPGGFTAAWGSTVGTDTVVGTTGDGASHDLVINARIPAGQNTVPTGTYADTVTVNVTF
jgi:spore coat protein U-like protein